MKLLQGNISAVNGFTALGKHIGIKKGKKDFAVIYSDKPCTATGVFTKNQVKGAPLYINMEHLKNGKAQVIVINSGIANVATGENGKKDAQKTCELAAEEFGIDKNLILVASTGIIGKKLPMNLIAKGIKNCKSQLTKEHQAAEAILTTDTVKKEIAVQSDGFTIGAMAKGSGMISPNMATMFCFITTDADLPAPVLKSCLVSAVNDSFNMLSIDMDTSTSDMVILLSNNTKKADPEKFQKALQYVCTEMTKKIAFDGEGATKQIEVEVINAKTKQDAKKIAKAIISSTLFKCAMFGNDPNWGRIICAAGYSGGNFSEEKLDIYLQNRKIVTNGVESPDFDISAVSDLLRADVVSVVLDLKSGKESATAYGCDMSYDYIRINAEYHT